MAKKLNIWLFCTLNFNHSFFIFEWLYVMVLFPVMIHQGLSNHLLIFARIPGLYKVHTERIQRTGNDIKHSPYNNYDLPYEWNCFKNHQIWGNISCRKYFYSTLRNTIVPN